MGYVLPINEEIIVDPHDADISYFDEDCYENVEQSLKVWALNSVLAKNLNVNYGEFEVDYQYSKTVWKGNTVTDVQGFRHSLELQRWINSDKIEPVTIRIDLDNPDDFIFPGTICVV